MPRRCNDVVAIYSRFSANMGKLNNEITPMYSRLEHPPVRFDDYRPLLDSNLADELAAVAGALGKLRVLHLNSTATGGGVAEILQSMIPLGNSLGIETERVVINPDAA